MVSVVCIGKHTIEPRGPIGEVVFIHLSNPLSNSARAMSEAPVTWVIKPKFGANEPDNLVKVRREVGQLGIGPELVPQPSRVKGVLSKEVIPHDF
jgi:hypothetical protein